MTPAEFAALVREFLAASQVCHDLRIPLAAAQKRANDLADEYHAERRRRESGEAQDRQVPPS